MRTWSYCEPRGVGGNVQYYITDKQIYEEYWTYWSNQMVRLGRYDQITIENCIQDFITIHWAWEVKDEVRS